MAQGGSSSPSTQDSDSCAGARVFDPHSRPLLSCASPRAYRRIHTPVSGSVKSVLGPALGDLHPDSDLVPNPPLGNFRICRFNLDPPEPRPCPCPPHPHCPGNLGESASKRGSPVESSATFGFVRFSIVFLFVSHFMYLSWLKVPCFGPCFGRIGLVSPFGVVALGVVAPWLVCLSGLSALSELADLTSRFLMSCVAE